MVMIGFLLIAIVIVLALGLVFKILKIAIIAALLVGGFLVIQDKFGTKRIK